VPNQGTEYRVALIKWNSETGVILDGNPVPWNSLAGRPDVYTGAINLGRALIVCAFDILRKAHLAIMIRALFFWFPFEQCNHAGRRLLLSEPSSDIGSVKVAQLENSALYFQLVNLPAYVVLDLGRTIHGRLRAEVSGPSGTIIDIGWDERLLPGSIRPLPYPGSLHPQWNQVDSWVLAGTQRPGTIDARGGKPSSQSGDWAGSINNLEVEERIL
jgi:hypothetical protein